MPLRSWIAPVCALAVCAACSDASDYTRSHTAGDACLLPQGVDPRTNAEVTYVAGEPIEVTMYFDTCLSSSCERVEGEPRCDANLEGNVITVSGSATVINFGGGGPCTLDCVSVAATCELPALAPGDYEVRVDGVSEELTVPSTNDSPLCVGTGSSGTPW